MTREESREILTSMMESPALLAHVRSVEIVMEAYAKKYGEDSDHWAITGLLHDADYEKHPEEHPKVITALLQERGETEKAHAIHCHYTKWGYQCETLLDKALLASDELTGLIIAVARLRPNKLQDLTPKSVKKKLKDKNFAAGVDRSEVHTGMELLEVDLDDHISFIIEALKPFEKEVIV
ncbi:MAG: HD domain-containing protein [Planctomycetota bacterium]|nr:HD domain-containing protein [Planctomycetota bacterium]MDG2083782.1 HD domain-containing protein [Planctomycetota bacterium]